jgi:dephospho-CoA kinase
MLKIGLTGGIGSGKSTVAGIFNILGIPIFDADSEAKKIMQTDEALSKAIQDEFGEDTYTAGKLNRTALANIVFGDPYRLAKLNAIVHPVTIAAAITWMKQQTTPYVVKEAALMFEAGSTTGLDYIVGVYAPKHIRINRVMNRDKSDREQVLERMSRQIDEELKMRLCDFVIINDEQQLLIPQVITLHEKFTLESSRSFIQ